MQLYAAYKCVTAGIKPTTSRPSFFDMTGRAKWDAWDDLSKKLEDDVDPVQTAERLYVGQARSLGWDESQETPSNDQEGAGRGSRSGGGGGGMGVSVSVPAGTDNASVEDSVHGFAINGNVGGLEALLDEQPALVNARDEFVSTSAGRSEHALIPPIGIYTFASGSGSWSSRCGAFVAEQRSRYDSKGAITL